MGVVVGSRGMGRRSFRRFFLLLASTEQQVHLLELALILIDDILALLLRYSWGARFGLRSTPNPATVPLEQVPPCSLRTICLPPAQARGVEPHGVKPRQCYAEAAAS